MDTLELCIYTFSHDGNKLFLNLLRKPRIWQDLWPQIIPVFICIYRNNTTSYVESPTSDCYTTKLLVTLDFPVVPYSFDLSRSVRVPWFFVGGGLPSRESYTSDLKKFFPLHQSIRLRRLKLVFLVCSP